MAANPLPLLALAGAAFFLMKRKDEPKPAGPILLPSPHGNGANGGTDQPADGPADEPAGEPADEPADDTSQPSDGTADIMVEREFSVVKAGTLPIEFKPNKIDDAVLITNVDPYWAYVQRLSGEMAGEEADFAKIHQEDGHLFWISTQGARPLEEMTLEGIPDPAKPNERVVLAWM